jgi:hypothetical protein
MRGSRDGAYCERKRQARQGALFQSHREFLTCCWFRPIGRNGTHAVSSSAVYHPQDEVARQIVAPAGSGMRMTTLAVFQHMRWHQKRCAARRASNIVTFVFEQGSSATEPGELHAISPFA